jgi:RimJ/RimL family protein N-acetyltransferase
VRLVLGRDVEVSAWTRARIPHCHDWGPCAAIGVADGNEELIAGVVFNNYHPHYKSIEISTASSRKRWLTKSLITGIFAYPFAQLGCQRVTAATPRNAHTARQFLETFGFQPEGIVRLGFGSQDALLFGLLASEWATHRYNLGRVVDGQGRPHAADAA